MHIAVAIHSHVDIACDIASVLLASTVANAQIANFHRAQPSTIVALKKYSVTPNQEPHMPTQLISYHACSLSTVAM